MQKHRDIEPLSQWRHRNNSKTEKITSQINKQYRNVLLT